MTRNRALTMILLGLFVIVAVINLLLYASGLTGHNQPSPAANPSPYFVETKNSP